MADVSIAYKGSVIAEMEDAGSRTLKTGGFYCEGDVTVSYTPNSREYKITLPSSFGWVLLTELDDDVLEHINDISLEVSLTRDGFKYEGYSSTFAHCRNEVIGHANGIAVYGMANRLQNESAMSSFQFFYPTNKTDLSTGLGGYQFRIDSEKYYFRPGDGYIAAGTYRLLFVW